MMSINELLSVFANNILPIILLSGSGFALAKLLHIDSRSLGRVVFYVFSPVLIFDILIKNKLDWPVLISILITTMFANTGNYGLPLVSFAFGEKALPYASIFFITTTTLFYTLGVLIASLGHMNIKEAALGLFKIPTLYAVALAVLINAWSVTIPAPVYRAVELASGGTIPLMLILLGVELSKVELSGSIRAMQLSVTLRLLVAPLIALLFAAFFGFTGVVRQGTVIQASMPSMVSATVLATEYKLDSKLITAIIFISTILSPLTLTPLLVLLGAKP
jgi:predicted permease